MIGIIDYGLGNVKAFANIYKKLNLDYKRISSVDDFKDITKIILPGVGAFDYAMQCLNKSGMRDILNKKVLNENIPVIGVCVGMQMLAKSSEEGKVDGLGWIDGVVKKFDLSKLNEQNPLPHMGWNTISIIKQSSLVANLERSASFYFLHSYYFECENNDDIIAPADYGDDFACIVNKNNIFGIQCHPEKSHHNGVALLKNFGEL